MLYMILKHAHSGLRWAVLLFLVAAVANAFMKWRGGKAHSESDRKLGFFAMLFSHIQLVIGLILYFISPKVVFSAESMKIAMNRFFLVEHSFLMILAILLLTLGYSRAKRAASDASRFKLTFWFYLIALILILAGIPWPSKGYGTGWF
jgi:uncharacterized protein YacL